MYYKSYYFIIYQDVKYLLLNKFSNFFQFNHFEFCFTFYRYFIISVTCKYKVISIITFTYTQQRPQAVVGIMCPKYCCYYSSRPSFVFVFHEYGSKLGVLYISVSYYTFIYTVYIYIVIHIYKYVVIHMYIDIYVQLYCINM